MQPATSLTRLFLLGSALVFASSCGGNTPRPAVAIQPPADLLERADEPPHTAAALNSEEVYERERDAKIEWGRANAGTLDRACWWLQDAGVTGLRCRERPR